MKKLALSATLLLSSLAFADVDYSRCNNVALGFSNASIDNDGKLVAGQGAEITDVKTVGNQQSYKLKAKGLNPWGGAYETESEVSLTRDKNGRVTKVTIGGEKPSAKLLEMHKSMQQNRGGFYPGGYGMGMGMGMGSGPQQPLFHVGGQSVPFNQLTLVQAEQLGIATSMKEYRKLQRQRRKNKKEMEKMQKEYAKIQEAAQYDIPFGQEYELDVEDGLCLLKSQSQRVYSTRTKEVSNELLSSRESCEEIKKLNKKYERKLNECQSVNEKLHVEYWEKFGSKFYRSPHMGGMVGGFNGGAVGGMNGGIVGGAVGGMSGGIAGGSVAGGDGGVAAAGQLPGFGLFTGALFSPISSQLWSCEMYYGVQPNFGINQGSFGSGINSGSGIGF